MKAHWTVQAAIGFVALTVLQAALSVLAPASGRDVPPGLAGVLASNALTAVVLAWIHARLGGTGLRRAAVLWAVWGGLQACSLVELVLFDVRIPEGHLPRLAAYLLAVSAAFAAFLGFAFRSSAARPGAAAAPWPSWWRFAVADLAYVTLYFAAGTLVYPYIRAFYEASPMPSFGAVLATQLVRGLALSAIVLLVVRRLEAPPLAAAAAAGAALGIVGGVAPLLIPNPYLPDAIRHAHLAEVGVSNFLFGVVGGLLLGVRPAPGRAAEVAAAPA